MMKTSPPMTDAPAGGPATAAPAIGRGIARVQNGWGTRGARPRQRNGGAGPGPSGARVSCDETRSLGPSRNADQDRLSEWNSRSCRQSAVPTATVPLGALESTVQNRVRGHHFIWTFRTEDGNLIATIIVDGEAHPISQLRRFTRNDEYAGQGLTQPMWDHVESMLMDFQFEEVLYDAARHMTDDEMRSSLGKFYEMQGVILADIERTAKGSPLDRWTVQDPSGIHESELACTEPPAKKALSIKLLPDVEQTIPEGSPSAEYSPFTASSGSTASTPSRASDLSSVVEMTWSGSGRRRPRRFHSEDIGGSVAGGPETEVPTFKATRSLSLDQVAEKAAACPRATAPPMFLSAFDVPNEDDDQEQDDDDDA